jgi:hypothetical protein
MLQFWNAKMCFTEIISHGIPFTIWYIIWPIKFVNNAASCLNLKYLKFIILKIFIPNVFTVDFVHFPLSFLMFTSHYVIFSSRGLILIRMYENYYVLTERVIIILLMMIIIKIVTPSSLTKLLINLIQIWNINVQQQTR